MDIYKLKNLQKLIHLHVWSFTCTRTVTSKCMLLQSPEYAWSNAKFMAPNDVASLKHVLPTTAIQAGLGG